MPIFGKRKQPDVAKDPLESIRHRLLSGQKGGASTEVLTDLVTQMSKDDLLLNSSRQVHVAPETKDEALPRRVDHRQV